MRVSARFAILSETARGTAANGQQGGKTTSDRDRTTAAETVEGTIKSVVYRNEDNGYTVLHVELPSAYELARLNEITVVGKTQAVWEGEDVRAEGTWVTDKVHGR
ncbi:MAG: hypothetical protein IJS46_05010 [Kiritimatiellae bacterium]|nr:hypothetical protein [Kiritimatiellia bacterium]